jgi:outer membrane protein OmpA-like peptidoglycan-associated protein
VTRVSPEPVVDAIDRSRSALEGADMTRVVATVAVVAVIAGGCASQPAAPRVATPAPPAAPAPFSDRELADELARQGVGVPKDAPTTPPGPGQDVPTEIRQTPRGVVVTFRYVLFAFDSDALTPQARREIEHPQAATRRITLEGHTDAIGTEAYNLDLSRRRAQGVAQELVARGIQRDRLISEGLGKQRPVAPNTLADGKDNPAGRALNRRVEAVVQATGGAR